MTLIEVLAALALLGSLAVAMLLSRSRLIDQHARAEQKLEAVRAADTLLSQWWADDPSAFPVDREGDIAGHTDWVWQTRQVQHDNLRTFEARVVRLRILDESTPGQPAELTSVDLVLPAGGSR